MRHPLPIEIAAFTKLKPLIHYDAEQGRVYWLKNRSRMAKAGGEIGTNVNGQRRFKLHGKTYSLYRFIFWIETHSLPELIIHRIGDLNERGEKDNRFLNLRDATQPENVQNVTSYYR